MPDSIVGISDDSRVGIPGSTGRIAGSTVDVPGDVRFLSGLF
jgi:hypothetical protein